MCMIINLTRQAESGGGILELILKCGFVRDSPKLYNNSKLTKKVAVKKEIQNKIYQNY